jgi:hypothetical protein
LIFQQPLGSQKTGIEGIDRIRLGDMKPLFFGFFSRAWVKVVGGFSEAFYDLIPGSNVLQGQWGIAFADLDHGLAICV